MSCGGRQAKIISLLALLAFFFYPGVSWGGTLQKGPVENLERGVSYYTFELVNREGKQVKGYAVEIDPQDKLIEVRPVLGEERLGGLERVSDMAARCGAVVAVNGGFYDPGSGHPVGNLVLDKKLLVSSDMLRTSVGFTSGGNLLAGYFAPRVTVNVGGSSFPVAGANRHPGADEVTLFTREWGEYTPAATDAVSVAVWRGQGGTTIKEKVQGQVAIPDGGYALVFRGQVAAWASYCQPGDGVGLKIEEGDGWDNLRHLVTGGPLLVEDGVPVFHAVMEGFKGSVLEPAARTAIGQTTAGKIILVVVEGDKGTGSGVTFEEMAWLLVELGAQKAVALDGGSSSVMWVKNSVANTPSAGSERRVANAIVVLRQVPVYVDGKRIFFDVPPLVEDGRTLVPLRGVFEALGAGVVWDAATKTVKASFADREIIMKTGAWEALVNGKQVGLDAPARVVDGRTLVPLRFMSENLGATVHWQSNPPTIFVKSPGEGVN